MSHTICLAFTPDRSDSTEHRWRKTGSDWETSAAMLAWNATKPNPTIVCWALGCWPFAFKGFESLKQSVPAKFGLVEHGQRLPGHWASVSRYISPDSLAKKQNRMNKWKMMTEKQRCSASELRCCHRCPAGEAFVAALFVHAKCSICCISAPPYFIRIGFAIQSIRCISTCTCTYVYIYIYDMCKEKKQYVYIYIHTYNPHLVHPGESCPGKIAGLFFGPWPFWH